MRGVPTPIPSQSKQRPPTALWATRLAGAAIAAALIVAGCGTAIEIEDGTGPVDPRPTVGTQPTSPPITEGATLLWEDNFDEFDRDKWEIISGTYGNASNTLHCYLPANIAMEEGNLQLQARQQSTNCEGGNQQYTSGMVWSKEAFDFTYGRVEVRMLVPSGQGFWPAAWMSPRGNTYGEWPISGEIDIIEFVGHEPEKAVLSLHWADASGDQQSNVENVAVSPDTFHVYAVEWTEQSVEWFIDDELVHSVTSWDSPANSAFPAPFDRPFFIKLNLAVGGDWPGSPDNTTLFPNNMLVDWVRVYEVS